MSVELISVDHKSFSTGAFIARWQTNQARPEELKYIKDAAGETFANRNRLHILQIDGVDYGFTTVCVRHFSKPYPNKFYVEVKLLFVQEQFRNRQIDELEGMHASAYLMSQVLLKSLEMTQFVPLESIVLLPAHTKLISFYEALGYEPLINTLGYQFISLRS